MDTSNVTGVSAMFYDCTNLKEIYVKNNETKNKFTTLNANVSSDCQVIIKT